MKAILIERFINAYSDLYVSTVPSPIPTANQILVSVTHAGLNYVDLLYSRGLHQNNRSLITPPFILGLEFSGTVISSPETSSFRPGNKVFGGCKSGAFAEQIVVEESAIRNLPDGWSAEAAAGMAATAPVSYGALMRIAKLQEGETVLVHAAAGGLGVMAVQIAKAFGARVIGTVGSDEKMDLVRSLGADAVINYSIEGWEKQVLEATQGRGVDVTFDSVGLVERSIRCSKYAGRIVIVGFAGREGNLEKIAANRVLLKSITLLGYRFGEHGRQFLEETPAIWSGVQQLIDRGQLKPVIFNGSFDGLNSVPDAMKAMSKRKIWGKAVIRIHPDVKRTKL